MEPITSNRPKRLLYLYIDNSNYIIVKICMNFETFSTILTGEFATRTWLNLENLKVIRGKRDQNKKLLLNTSMSGPHDYFGWINPFHTHIIKQDACGLRYYKTTPLLKDTVLFKLKTQYITTINNYEWISHCKNSTINSLFIRPGILKLHNYKYINFDIIDNPEIYDLSSFKARVVNNKEPFSFNYEVILKYNDAQCKLRIITYNYGKDYVREYLDKTDGIFIEKHEFIQIITPYSKDCYGYIILGRQNNGLELIAIKLKFGYSILIEPYCIHGDSCLVGQYMMAMTGRHDIMNKADTVFLKQSDGITNIKTNIIKQKTIFTSDILVNNYNTENVEQLKTEISYKYGYNPVIMTL